MPGSSSRFIIRAGTPAMSGSVANSRTLTRITPSSLGNRRREGIGTLPRRQRRRGCGRLRSGYGGLRRGRGGHERCRNDHEGWDHAHNVLGYRNRAGRRSGDSRRRSKSVALSATCHFEPVQFLLDLVKRIVADLVVGAHGENGLPRRLEGAAMELAVRDADDRRRRIRPRARGSGAR